MKAVTTIIILLILPFQITAQNSIDHLKRELQNQNNHEKAIIFNSIANEYLKLSNADSAMAYAFDAVELLNSEQDLYTLTDSYNHIASAFTVKRNVDSAFTYSNKAMKLADSIGYPLGKGNALRNLGAANLYSGNLKDAEEETVAAIEILSKTNSQPAIASAKLSLGVAYMYNGKNEKAVEAYFEAGKLYLEIGDSLNFANAYLNIGSIYSSVLGKYESALEVTLKALKIFESVADSFKIATSKLILGSVYEFTNRIPNAIEYYEQALAIYEMKNNDHMQGLTLNYIGEACKASGNYEKALTYYKRSLELNYKISHDEGVAIAKYNIGDCYFNLFDYTEALKYQNQAHEHFLKINDRAKLAESYYGLGKINSKLNRNEIAERDFLKSVQLALELGTKEILKDSYEALSELTARTKRFSDAYKYFKLFESVKDSLINENTLKNLSELEAKYDAEAKSKEIEILKRDNRIQDLALQRQRILTFALILFLIVILIAVYFYYRKNKQHIIANKKLELKNIQVNEQKQKVKSVNVELTATNEKLKQSEKSLIESNATKDKFFSIIAHDLRSPFNSLLGFIDYLSDNFDDLSNSEKMKILGDLRNSSIKVNSLLENLLNWSLSQFQNLSLSIEVFDLNEHLLRNYDLYEKSIKEKNLRIKFGLSEKANVKADRNMIDTVIRNILGNAVKFSEKGGSVELKTLNEKNTSKCVIADSGVGMEKKTLNKLFDIKNTIKQNREPNSGSGLGLLICNEFIQKNNGKLEINSKPGEGTTVVITLHHS